MKIHSPVFPMNNCCSCWCCWCVSYPLFVFSHSYTCPCPCPCSSSSSSSAYDDVVDDNDYADEYVLILLYRLLPMNRVILLLLYPSRRTATRDLMLFSMLLLLWNEWIRHRCCCCFSCFCVCQSSTLTVSVPPTTSPSPCRTISSRTVFLYLLTHRIILLLPSSIYECATPLAIAIRVVLLPPSNRIIVAPSIVSVPVVFAADVIIDAGVYYLLQASTLHLLLLLYYYYYVVVHL